MNVDAGELRPRRHNPGAGWSPEVFERLTDALAAALVAGYRRNAGDETYVGGVDVESSGEASR